MYDGLTNMNTATTDYFLDYLSNNQYQVTNSNGLILEQNFYISEVGLKHNRRSFTVWMLLALIGGIIQSLLIGFNWIVSPFAKFGW